MSFSIVDNCLTLLDWLAPPLCRQCGTAGARSGYCEGCRQDLPWNELACPSCAEPQTHAALCASCSRRPRAFDAAFAPLRMQDGVRSSMHAFKYRARFDEGDGLARLMAERLLQQSSVRRPDVLIPVPLHWSRLVERGYNQSAWLARSLGRELNLPVWHAAKRVRGTPRQVNQSLTQRRRNLRGAFRCQRPLQGLSVALVDDVMTSGATLEELSRCVKQSGAVHVQAWVLARRPRRA